MNDDLLIGVFGLISFGLIILIFIIRLKKINSYYQPIIDELDEKEKKKKIEFDRKMEKYFPNYSKEKMENEIFFIFRGVQDSIMNFDYDKLNELCSEELYLKYKTELDSLKKEKRKRIFSCFELEGVCVDDIIESNGKAKVIAGLTAFFDDFIIDEEKIKLVRDHKKHEAFHSYTIECSIDNKRLLLDCIKEDE